MMLLLVTAGFLQVQAKDPGQGEKIVARVERDMADLGIKGPFKLASLLNEDSSFLGADRWEMTIVAGNGDQYYVFAAGGTPRVISRGAEFYDQSDLPTNDVLPVDSPLFTNEADFLSAVLSKRSEIGHPSLTIEGNTAIFGVPILKNGYPFVGAPCEYSVAFRADLNLITKISEYPLPPINTAAATLTESQGLAAADAALRDHVVKEFQNGWHPFQNAELTGPPSLAYFRDYKDPIAKLSWIAPFRVTYAERKPPPGRRIYATEGPPNEPTVGSVAVDATTGQYIGKVLTGSSMLVTAAPTGKLGKYSILDLTDRTGSHRPRVAQTSSSQPPVQVKADQIVGEDYVALARRTMDKLYGDDVTLHLTGVYQTTDWGPRRPTWLVEFEDEDGNLYTVLADGQTQSITYVSSFAPPENTVPVPTDDDLRFARQVFERLGTKEDVELAEPLFVNSDHQVGASGILKHEGHPFFNTEPDVTLFFTSGSHRITLYSAPPLPPVNATTPKISADAAQKQLLAYASTDVATDSAAEDLNRTGMRATFSVNLGYYKLRSEPTARLVYAGEVSVPTTSGRPIVERLAKFVDALTGELVSPDEG